MQDSKDDSKALCMRPLKSNLALKTFLQCTLSDNTLVQNPSLPSHPLRSMYQHLHDLASCIILIHFLPDPSTLLFQLKIQIKTNIFQFSQESCSQIIGLSASYSLCLEHLPPFPSTHCSKLVPNSLLRFSFEPSSVSNSMYS